jgi:hypothetical protein
MTVHVVREDGRVTLAGRADSAGGAVGDLHAEVTPGGEWYGVPYAWWADHLGPVVVEEAWAALGITVDDNRRLRVPAAVRAQITTPSR